MFVRSHEIIHHLLIFNVFFKISIQHIFEIVLILIQKDKEISRIVPKLIIHNTIIAVDFVFFTILFNSKDFFSLRLAHFWEIRSSKIGQSD